MKVLFLYTIFALLIVDSFAQETTKFAVYANPSGYYRVKIDGKLQPVNHKFILERGKHQFQIWAPGYHIKDTTVNVQGDSSYIRVQLTQSAEYKHHLVLEGQKDIIIKKAGAYYITGGAVGLLAFVPIYNVYNDKLEYEIAKDLYKDTGIRDDFDYQRKGRIVNEFIAVGLFSVAALLIRKGTVVLKKKELVPKSDYMHNRSFELTDIGFNYNPQFHQSQINFSLRF